MQKILRACDEAPPVIPSLQIGLSSVSAVEEDQFIPAVWSPAARWSACASAPPSCPCSSDSLSSAAECLPVSDTLRIRRLTSAGTEKRSQYDLRGKCMFNKHRAKNIENHERRKKRYQDHTCCSINL